MADSSLKCNSKMNGSDKGQTNGVDKWGQTRLIIAKLQALFSRLRTAPWPSSPLRHPRPAQHIIQRGKRPTRRYSLRRSIRASLQKFATAPTRAGRWVGNGSGTKSRYWGRASSVQGGGASAEARVKVLHYCFLAKRKRARIIELSICLKIASHENHPGI